MNSQFPEMDEMHCTGLVSIDNRLPMAAIGQVDFGIQIAPDGRVWICINGISFLRFKPNRIQLKSNEEINDKP